MQLEFDNVIPLDRERLRIPPHSIEAESSLLGALLLDNGAWEQVDGMVTESDFYRGEHRQIFRALAALIAADKPAAFLQLSNRLRELGADLIILARFMQILPDVVCREFSGRVINIHHSFLPAFVGANPYRRAFERGVKLIGATCHYATEDLDEGPIIEQEVSRVEHYHEPEDLVRLGRDCERLALARGVRYHVEDRVLVHGNRAIVFRD